MSDAAATSPSPEEREQGDIWAGDGRTCQTPVHRHVPCLTVPVMRACVCVCLYKNDASQILICVEGFIVLVMARVSWKRTVEVEQRGEDRRPEAGID